MKKIIFYIVLLVLIIAGAWLIMRDVSPAKIASFEECVEAGYPVMESYPRQCRSADGTLFVETIEKIPTISASFACDGGKTIQAVFQNEEPRTVDLALGDGRMFSLPQALSASGARYTNEDESFVFWNKGDTAFILENEEETYTNCLVIPKEE